MSDDWQRNEITFFAEVDPLREHVWALQRQMYDRILYPWKYPDRPRMPAFEPFPRFNNFALKVARKQRQAETIWWNLRHLTEPRSDPYDY